MVSEPYRIRCTWRFVALVGVVVCCGALSAPAWSDVVINEVLARNERTILDEDSEPSDWIELFNAGDAVVDLEGRGLSDDPDDPTRWVFPLSQVLAPGEYLLVWCSGKNRSMLPPERLLDDSGVVPFEPILVNADAEWRYLTGQPDDAGPPADWSAPDFDDSAWPAGQPGFGFGDNDDRTVLPEDIGAVFLRHRFVFDAAVELPSLVLRALYDDGIVVWLNGQRVLSANFPPDEEPTFASLAARSHEARNAERFDLSAVRGLLVPGENVLAIALLNQRVASNDLSLVPELGRVPHVFHTSFRLSGEGETVVLSDARGGIADWAVLPPQVDDQSYGRSPNGNGPFRYHATPTPGAANSGPVADEPLVVVEPTFSVDRGFHDEPFAVELATTTAGAVIRYTLDGSAPTATTGEVYTAPIPVDDTTTLRAGAFRPEWRASRLVTHTYVFITRAGGGGVLNQPRNPPGFPLTWGGAGAADYQMDPRVATDTGSADFDPDVAESLLCLPTMSLVLDRDDLFDPARGIYSNPQSTGVAWERPTSVELIHPDGTMGFQVNAGLRIQGGASRNPNRPKHNMRLLFKTDYGPGKLRYPLFEDTVVQEFDTIVLRGGNGDSWFHPNTTQQVRAQYVRDQWHRDAQIDMGRLTTHQAYMHLYINGLYWGVYHIFERPSAPFLAAYLGGDRTEYDALNLGEPVDGDLEAWNAMMALGNAGVSTPEAYTAIQEYLDVPNLIDFLLVNYYSGNVDWDHNNWYAGRRREPGAGYRFFVWDAERTYWDLNTNRVTLNNANRPTGLHTRLRQNAEYRLLFADHIQRHFFLGGTLTPEAAERRWLARADEVAPALSAEAARWGDAKRPARPYTRDREWAAELASLRRTWFPQRTGIVLGQLRSAGLWPALAAPVFSRHGGRVPSGFAVDLTAPEGEVWYTADGSDPRLEGGDVAPTARLSPGFEPRTEVDAGAAVRVLVPTDDTLGTDWTATDFDDSAWIAGRTGVGYESRTGFEELIETDVLDAMLDANASVYLRVEFDLDPASADELRLLMKYDDGFVAYLDGVRVASANAPDDVTWESAAIRSHPDRLAREFEAFPLPGVLGGLRAGRHVLAVHGMNIRSGDSDCLIVPVLESLTSTGERIVLTENARLRARARSGDEWSPLSEAVFVVEGSYPLRISELMYRPAPDPAPAAFDADAFEFIEFENVGRVPIELAGARLERGVEFDFSESVIDRIEPGGVLVLVRDFRAFRTRYDTRGMPIGGEYRGVLSNSGERLVLRGPLGETLLDFQYDDAWYPEASGRGRSLVLTGDDVSPDAFSDAVSWRPSAADDGTPGRDDTPPVGGQQLPGDADQDGVLSLSDAVTLLGWLFLGVDTPLPCEGSVSDDGNLTLLDVDATGRVDLSDAVVVLGYLFLGGPPPALGVECVPIPSCPDACAP